MTRLADLTEDTDPSDEELMLLNSRRVTFANVKAAIKGETIADLAPTSLSVVAYTESDQVRPSTAGPVLWVGDYSSLGPPDERVAGDLILDRPEA